MIKGHHFVAGVHPYMDVVYEAKYFCSGKAHLLLCLGGQFLVAFWFSSVFQGDGLFYKIVINTHSLYAGLDKGPLVSQICSILDEYV